MLIIAKCHWVVSIHLPCLAQYAPITLQMGGFDPPPLARVSMLPLHYNDLV